MASFESSVEINVPVRTAYNQWTQFEEFQRFMDGVEEVRQLDETRLLWKVSIAGKEEEWRRRTGRPMTAAELERVIQRYPGDL